VVGVTAAETGKLVLGEWVYICMCTYKYTHVHTHICFLFVFRFVFLGEKQKKTKKQVPKKAHYINLCEQSSLAWCPHNIKILKCKWLTEKTCIYIYIHIYICLFFLYTKENGNKMHLPFILFRFLFQIFVFFVSLVFFFSSYSNMPRYVCKMPIEKSVTSYLYSHILETLQNRRV